MFHAIPYTRVACIISLPIIALLWASISLGASSLSLPGGDGTASDSKAGPHLINLRRELHPVRRNGKILSYKASYSGVVHVGSPWAQEFRVVFDTGSGHVILPSTACQSNACLKHRRYDMKVSESAEVIMLDGKPVPPSGLADQVTIGFGTGKITGEFVRDVVCLGPARPSDNSSSPSVGEPGPCVSAQIVVATEMSDRPFELFAFDGIFGLGLQSLAISKNFSFFNILAGSDQMKEAHFGVFLTDGDDGGDSEIAIGGHNIERLADPLLPLDWVPMAKPELGYWQVEILSVRINGLKLDMCSDDRCFGILDTGTSHLGIPSLHHDEMADKLTVDAGEVADCRQSEAPIIQFELSSINITLNPENYMRRLPLPEDTLMDSSMGVSPTSYKETENKESDGGADTTEVGSGGDLPEADMKHLCTPKLLPVTWPAPLGPNLFILGEPVLHRYYTVFDWGELRAGFGLAKHTKTTDAQEDSQATAASSAVRGAASPVRQDEVMLMQAPATASFAEDDVVFMQVTVSVRLSRVT